MKSINIPDNIKNKTLEELKIETTEGLNSLTCSAKSKILLPATIPATVKWSRFFRTTSRVFTPIDPVDPKIEIIFINVDLNS